MGPDQPSILQLNNPAGSLVDVGVVAGHYHGNACLGGDLLQKRNDARTGQRIQLARMNSPSATKRTRGPNSSGSVSSQARSRTKEAMKRQRS